MPLGLGVERFEVVAKALETSSVVIAGHCHCVLEGGSDGWCRLTGVGSPGKNLLWKIAAFLSLELTAGPFGPCSGGNMAVRHPFWCCASAHMSAISTASWRHSWAQSLFAWDITWLRFCDALQHASFLMVERVSVCATLHASFHHLALLGFGNLFRGSVQQQACSMVELNC